MAEFGAEGILLAGAGRALLLQLADPAVGRGVDEHSTFVGRPVNRLKGTLTYVYAIVYGTDEQVKEVRRRVEKIYGPLDDESADAMYQDYARLGTALQVPPGMWPGDRAAFSRYWSGRISTLRAEDGGVRVGRGLLYPKHTALWYRAIMPSARFLTAGLLPDQIRKDFGLPWSDRHESRFNRTMRTTAVIYPKLPQGIRHWFKNYCLSSLDAEIRASSHAGKRPAMNA
jgi:uncharacterized protein (DUF2236 family)